MGARVPQPYESWLAPPQIPLPQSALFPPHVQLPQLPLHDPQLHELPFSRQSRLAPQEVPAPPAATQWKLSVVLLLAALQAPEGQPAHCAQAWPAGHWLSAVHQHAALEPVQCPLGELTSLQLPLLQ